VYELHYNADSMNNDQFLSSYQLIMVNSA
jgi:hypothetical protein